MADAVDQNDNDLAEPAACLWWGLDLGWFEYDQPLPWQTPGKEEEWDAVALNNHFDCAIETVGYREQGRRCIACVRESWVRAPTTTPRGLSGFTVKDEWRVKLEKFSQVLKLPKVEPEWHFAVLPARD